MATLATGQISIVDLADGKSLSCYINSNQPRIQVQEVNAGTFSPDWSIAAGNVVLTPVVYADQAQIPLNQAGLSIDWKRREGSASETALATGESAHPEAYAIAFSASVEATTTVTGAAAPPEATGFEPSVV